MELNIFDLRNICGFYDENCNYCKLTSAVYYDSIVCIDDDVEDCTHVFEYNKPCSLNNCPVYKFYKDVRNYCREYGVNG